MTDAYRRALERKLTRTEDGMPDPGLKLRTRADCYEIPSVEIARRWAEKAKQERKTA